MTARFNLTKQEYCVLSSLDQGLSVKAVAKNLDISLHTVNGHMKSIYFKMHVKSRGEAQHKFNVYKANDANVEKADRAAELVIANVELNFQNEEKAKRVEELVIANVEKADRAAELEAVVLGKNSANKKGHQTEAKFLQCLNILAMARDDETRNHILRTQYYVKAIALRLREMGNYKIELSDEMIKLLFKAAPLHDIGKVGIPNSILHKSGRLNDEEWQVMKTHATIGRAILSSAELETQGSSGVIRVGIKIAGEHHEKWDGSGYPNGLKGEKISLPARIMAIADAYDALMSKRIYKSGWSHEDVVDEIVSQRGVHFDPLVVDAFMIEKAEFLAIHSKYIDD